MDAASTAALFVTMLAVSLVPGPSDVAVAARSMTSGLAHGLAMTLGIILADAVFVLVAVYGLGVVATHSQTLWTLVRYAGGLWLLWLGVGVFRAPPVPVVAARQGPASRLSSIAGGLLITFGDPKAILFYMGLLPVFVDVARVRPADTLVIVLVATLVVGGVKGGWAWLASRATVPFARRRAVAGLQRLGGAVLVGTGLLLLARGT